MKQRLVTLAWHILGDRLADVLLWWFIFRTTKAPLNTQPRLIVLNHLFNQDLSALERANTAYSFIVIDAKVLRFVATFLFPPSVESYLIYNSAELAPLRKRWATIMHRFVTRLERSYHPHAVIAPSDNFFYVRELIPALQSAHIPYIVIDKEGTICPAYFVHFAQYIHDHCPLIADHILVWSERQKLFWEKTGVTDDKITVTGQPRSDFWRQPDRWKTKTALGIPGLRSNAAMFLFFTYDPWAYTPDYMVEKGEMHWDVLRQETHKTLFSFARQHPEIDLVIKAHPQQPDIDAVQQEIYAAKCPNVHLATGVALSNDLIINADCIIGFQTTALIEAMVTNKPIIYTFWGEAKDRWSNDLIPFHETAGVETVTSPDQLDQQLVTHLTRTDIKPAQRQARDAFIQEYFTIVDGRASERTLAALNGIVPALKP